jgi:hypothetical protein
MTDLHNTKTIFYACAGIGTILLTAGAFWLLTREEGIEEGYRNELSAIGHLKFT